MSRQREEMVAQGVQAMLSTILKDIQVCVQWLCRNRSCTHYPIPIFYVLLVRKRSHVASFGLVSARNAKLLMMDPPPCAWVSARAVREEQSDMLGGESVSNAEACSSPGSTRPMIDNLSIL